MVNGLAVMSPAHPHRVMHLEHCCLQNVRQRGNNMCSALKASLIMFQDDQYFMQEERLCHFT